MDNKKILANALLEIAKNSTTTFLADNEIDEEIKLAAKKMNIELPSPDLAIFKTIYAEIDKVNLNGVILPRKAVEEGIKTLIGKQVNFEHEGAGHVCGFSIDAKIKEDKVETTNVFFKSLFPEQFEELKEKIKTKEAAVSFEIWNRCPETGESVVHELEGGEREISPIIFHGTGLLLVHRPACPKAKIFQLVAKKLTDAAEKVMNRVFEKDLVFAELALEEPICQNCGNCDCKHEKEEVMEEILENDYEGGEIEEAKKLTTEQRNALPDSDFALIQERDGKKIRRFPINDEAHVRNALARLPQAKDITEEERKSALEKILKKAKEFNMTELLEKYKKAEEVENKVEEKAEEKSSEETKPAEETKPVEGAETKPEGEETKEEPTEEAKTEEKKEEVVVEEPKVEEPKVEAQAPVEEVKPTRNLIKIVTLDGTETTEIFAEGASTVDSKRRIVTIRHFSDGTEERSESVEEVVRTYSSAELEEKVNATKAEKDAEIASLKTATDELDKEIKNLKDELGKKDQEIAELKAPKVEEPKKEKEMTVGAVEIEAKSEIKKQAENINKIIANKGK